MESTHDFTSDGARLTDVVRGIRNRWRLKRALRGASIVIAGGFVLLATSAFILDALRYGETAVTVVRTLALLLLAVLAVIFVVLPLLPKRMPADRRVALYLEEHEPSLDAAVVTAVEMQEREGSGRTRSVPPAVGNHPDRGPLPAVGQPLSASLVAHLTHSALDRVHKIDDGRHVDERGRCADIGDGIRRCRERHRRGQHMVAASDVQDL